MVDLVQIPTVLARVPRFGGRTPRPWSVWQHTILVACAVWQHRDLDLLEQAIVHDWHEAYVGDVTTPIKRLLGAPWHELETRIAHVVRDAAGVPRELDPRVALADYRAYVTEVRMWDLEPAEYECSSLAAMAERYGPIAREPLDCRVTRAAEFEEDWALTVWEETPGMTARALAESLAETWDLEARERR